MLQFIIKIKSYTTEKERERDKWRKKPSPNKLRQITCNLVSISLSLSFSCLRLLYIIIQCYSFLILSTEFVTLDFASKVCNVCRQLDMCNVYRYCILNRVTYKLPCLQRTVSIHIEWCFFSSSPLNWLFHLIILDEHSQQWLYTHEQKNTTKTHTASKRRKQIPSFKIEPMLKSQINSTLIGLCY